MDLYPRYCRASFETLAKYYPHHMKQTRNDSSCCYCHGLSEMNPKQRTNMVSILEGEEHYILPYKPRMQEDLSLIHI